MSIATECLVVNLQVGVWKGYRLDKEASRKVTDDANAAMDAARVNKHLVGKEALKGIETAASSVRSHFYDRTLPWKDNGDRLLPRKMFMAFSEQHNTLCNTFNNAVDHFLEAGYPSAREQARFRMGDLFKSEDYPTVSELRRKFYVNLDIDPVTTANDFRVDLDKKTLAQIKTDAEEALQRRLGKAMADVWERLATTLSHFAAKMSNPDEIFRDSTVRNLEEIVALLPDLNILNDPQLEKIRQDIMSNLGGYEPKDLRTDPLQRTVAASEASRILDDMRGFMNAFGAAA